jgi:hypothetical protein
MRIEIQFISDLYPPSHCAYRIELTALNINSEADNGRFRCAEKTHNKFNDVDRLKFLYPSYDR